MRWFSNDCSDLGDLIGETLVEVLGLEKGSARATFRTTSGKLFVMQHSQSCCENVDLEDVDGDVADIVGAPILMAEAVSNPPESMVDDKETGTWTFIKFGTSKGYVTARWYGSSNGYYSEEPGFCRMDEDR